MDDESFFPITFTNISAGFKADFPEVTEAYGDDAKLTVEATLSPRNTGQPISVTQADGIVLGGNKDLLVSFDLVASNATVKDDKAISFEAVVEARANLTMKDVMIYPKVNDVLVDSCNVVHSKVPLTPGKLYPKLFSKLLTQISGQFNEKYAKGISLGDILDPQAAMIGGLLKNITVSPYIADGWMYGGFSMYADQPYEAEAVEGPYELKFLQD